MSEKPNDGGPAFPVTASTGDPRDGVYCRDGMSLRDYFAAAALQGGSSHPDTINIHSMGKDVLDVAAKNCYAMADAMMKARER